MTATASPTWRTLSWARRGCWGLMNLCWTSAVHLLGSESCVSGTGGRSCRRSAPLRAQATPGAQLARARSTAWMRAWASGLRTKTACSMCGRSRSAMNCPRPVSRRWSSRRGSERPMKVRLLGSCRRGISLGRAMTHEIEPFVFGEHRHAEVLGLAELRAGAWTRDHVVGLLGYRPRDLGAEPFRHGFCFVAGHLF